MKHPFLSFVWPVILAGLLLSLGTARSVADGTSQLQGTPPKLDADGRFWVYRNGPDHPVMPFLPYGWSSDDTNLSRLIEIDLKCHENPNTQVKFTGPAERNLCIQMKFVWNDATWASVAFISGPDKPPWWGDTKGGRYYDLSTLARKKLVFYARGERGGETIKAQMGMLGDKPYGDSMSKPMISEEMKLTTDWIRYEIDLNGVAPSDLKAICNGFGVIAERASQPGSPADTEFYIDDVYFE